MHDGVFRPETTPRPWLGHLALGAWGLIVLTLMFPLGLVGAMLVGLMSLVCGLRFGVEGMDAVRAGLMFLAVLFVSCGFMLLSMPLAGENPHSVLGYALLIGSVAAAGGLGFLGYRADQQLSGWWAARLCAWHGVEHELQLPQRRWWNAVGFFWRAELGGALLFGFVMGITALPLNRPSEDDARGPAEVKLMDAGAVRLDEAPRDEDAADRP